MSFLLSRDLTGVDTARLASSICRGHGLLFERFDLQTRQRTRSVIAWRWQDLAGDGFEATLRAALETAQDDTLHVAFLGGEEARPSVARGGFPPWFVRRLTSWVELDFAKGAVQHVAAPGDVLDLAVFDRWLREAAQPHAASDVRPVVAAQDWRADLDPPGHASRLAVLQERIAAGEIEGAVLSVGLSRQTPAHPLDLYGEMARTNPSTFGYCFHGGEVALAGSSPLAFLDYDDGQVRLETDAGTRPVTGRADADALARSELLASTKDAAEHAVVVDEETQSLAALCVGGEEGVRRVVDREVRAFSHVMHLYTVLAAQMKPQLDLPAALMQLFPPAAVSGRPRRAARAAGCAVEAGPRGPYGGIAGLVRGQASAQFAVVIRSLWIEGGVARLRVGGKVVAGSLAHEEYDEALNKSRFLVNSVARVEAMR